MVLVRNDNWSPESDRLPSGLPGQDRGQVRPRPVGHRPAADPGLRRPTSRPPRSATRCSRRTSPPSSTTTGSRTAGSTSFDPYSDYYAINVKKVPNLKQRQAIAVALDRAQIRTIRAAPSPVTWPTASIKPNLPPDYAPSGMWTGLLGQKIPDTGDPELAKKLIAESGEPMPTITFDYGDTPSATRRPPRWWPRSAKAGIKVKPNPIEAGQYYSIVFDPDKAGELMWRRLGPGLAQRVDRHPGAVHPDRWLRPLPGRRQGLQRQGRRRAKASTDRAAQADAWKALNKEAMQNVWVIPTLFGRSQSLAGSKVHSASGDDGDVYFWAPLRLVAVRATCTSRSSRRDLVPS